MNQPWPVIYYFVFPDTDSHVYESHWHISHILKSVGGGGNPHLLLVEIILQFAAETPV